jgi:3-carboxy-cis,cis-muconate cycloisomerase
MSPHLEPGAHRAEALADDAAVDAALVEAMLDVERAWMIALADGGAAGAQHVAAVAAARPEAISADDIENVGNPVFALVASLRAAVDDKTARLVHRGLTSQDVLDTALMLIARDAVVRIDGHLARTCAALADAAEAHRATVMAGRTLTQYAVPVAFGLKAAQWLAGVLDARDALAALTFPVQCGGAAGTLSKAAQIVPDPLRAASILGETLGLAVTDLPWHTRRAPITRLGDALAEVCQSLGKIAADVLVLGRPEIGELSEDGAAGRGGSSTMPHKQNPVLSVLIRSASLRAPHLAAALHTCAALHVDERADGAWHAEWPALRDLLRLTLVAASQSAELTEGLVVHADVMNRRAREAAQQLLAERGGGDDPADYLGVSDAFIDTVLRRVERGADRDGRDG